MKAACIRKRFLSVISALMVLASAFAGMTVSVAAESVNLREHIVESVGLVQYYTGSGQVDVTSGIALLNEACENIHDGVNSTGSTCVSNTMEWDPPRYAGIRLKLDAVMGVERLMLYFGGGSSTYADEMKVYASDKLDDLYDEANLVTGSVTCEGKSTPQTVTVGRNIQYVAIFKIGGGDGNWRVYEAEIWGTQELLDDGNLRGHITEVQGLLENTSNGWVDESDRFKAANDKAYALIVDGDTAGQVDVWGAADWDPPRNVGVRLKLDEVTDVGNLVLYSGISTHTDVLKVCAAEKPEDLYKPENLVKKDIACNGQAVTVAIGRKIQYVAVFLTAYDGCGRFKEIELYRNDGTVEPAPDSDDGNLRKHIVNVQGLLEDINSGTVNENDRFAQGNSDAYELILDGDTAGQVDVYGAADWDPPKNVGVRLTLDAATDVSNLVLYSGTSSHPDVLKVYAAEKLGDLYKPESLVQQDITCNGQAVTVAIGRKVQYVAIFVTAYKDGCWRIKEVELYKDLSAALVEAVEAAGGVPEILGATVSRSSEQNILFKTKLPTAVTAYGYSLKEYGTLIIPNQYITDQNRKEGAELTYGNTWVATSRHAVGADEDVSAGVEIAAELRGSANGVYPGVRFAFRGYALYENEAGEQVIVYGNTDVRSVWGVSRTIAGAILERRDSTGLTAEIHYTDAVTVDVTADTLANVKSADVYAFICDNLAAVNEIAEKM